MIFLTRHVDADSSTCGTFLAVPTEYIERALANETSAQTRLAEDMNTFYLCDADQEKFLSKLDRLHLKYHVNEQVHRGISFIRDLSPAAWV